jgi:kynureninase
MVKFTTDAYFAHEMDDSDVLADFKKYFNIPKINGHTAIYFCGNSLGLQPKQASKYVQEELEDWAKYGVEGHFESRRPWFSYHHNFTKSLAKLVGATVKEVVAMNTLTVNLQLLMLSFYKPSVRKYKIIMEEGAFPSDMYAVETLVKHFGLTPKEAIVELKPRKNEPTLRTEDIISTIEKHSSSLAIVMIGGVHYYTGQLHNIEAITAAAHKAGAMAGFDLAHAVGNVPLQLHKWNVDFACWCTYKYLNSGPGAVGGAYIHEKHATNKKTSRLAGWWGHNENTRFLMQKGYDAMPNAQGWQMSNAPVMNMACLRASLDIFDKVDMKQLRAKSLLLHNYTRYLLSQIKHIEFTIITPENDAEHGCQISMLIGKKGKEIFNHLKKNGIIADWREPNVIRIAPVPLYNTFEDIYEFYKCLLTFK